MYVADGTPGLESTGRGEQRAAVNVPLGCLEDTGAKDKNWFPHETSLNRSSWT